MSMSSGLNTKEEQLKVSRPQKHSIRSGRDSKSNSKKFNYLLFESVSKFHDFVNHEITKLDAHNRTQFNSVNREAKVEITVRPDWYGHPVPSSITELDEHTAFLGIKLRQQLKPKIEKHLSEYLKYLDASVMPKPTVGYNDRGLGMFSFDRAAMGLYRHEKIALGTPIEKTATQINIELGRDQLNTNVKEVYAFFKNKNNSYLSIRLYLMAGANANVKGDDILYVGLTCAELVEFLEVRGVPVEVNVILGTSHNFQVCLACVTVKKFSEKIDINQLLLLSSDPRYFRYRGFKALIAISNYFGLQIPSGLGRIEKNMGDQFVQAYDPKGFVFEQSYSLGSAAFEVRRVVETYQNRLKIGKKIKQGSHQ